MGAHTTFEEFFKLLKQYQEEYGHCDVPSDYKVGTVKLGDIVSNIRGGKRKTTDDQKAMLDSIDFVWKSRNHNSPTSFDEVVNLLEKYKEEHGHCDVPQDCKVGTAQLGRFVRDIRTGSRKTTPEQKAMLDSIGFVWNVKKRTSFEEVFRLLVEYKEKHRHCDVPQDCKVGTINLGKIVSNIRCGQRKTTPEQKAKLDTLGFVWKKQNNT